MKVKQLIEQLQAMPQDTDVCIVYDGCARMNCEVAYLSQGGAVILIDHGDVVYDTEDRPIGAPTQIESPFWRIE